MHTSVILLYNFEPAILFVALMKTEMAIQVNLRKLRVHGDVLGKAAAAQYFQYRPGRGCNRTDSVGIYFLCVSV